MKTLGLIVISALFVYWISYVAVTDRSGETTVQLPVFSAKFVQDGVWMGPSNQEWNFPMQYCNLSSFQKHIFDTVRIFIGGGGIEIFGFLKDSQIVYHHELSDKDFRFGSLHVPFDGEIKNHKILEGGVVEIQYGSDVEKVILSIFLIIVIGSITCLIAAPRLERIDDWIRERRSRRK